MTTETLVILSSLFPPTGTVRARALHDETARSITATLRWLSRYVSIGLELMYHTAQLHVAELVVIIGRGGGGGEVSMIFSEYLTLVKVLANTFVIASTPTCAPTADFKGLPGAEQIKRTPG